ncbi:GFA family protein, partial [Rhizobium ruizarguesonis]
MLYEGSCHCGNVAFEVDGEFTEALDCNCSPCLCRRGAIATIP